ncbi:MAG TPA: M14 family metallopeptidase [Gemmatimonadales bacterium]|nr:M14 family metallopeptidase [Gemmatimonadales bacterium]
MRTALFLLLAAAPLAAQQTRPERTVGAETSSYADVVGFIDSLQRVGAPIRVGTLGTSPEGRTIPYLVVARPMVDDPGAAGRSGKPVFYIQGNIHSGEVEGKEALQMLVRDLAVGPLRSLLDSVIVVAVPIYNIDGNEKFGPGEKNRPGQNGPAVVGPSTNGQGLNLNRDYVKLEAPETRGSLALIAAWDPDFFIDLHTTDGSYHGYELTYATGLNPNSPPANEYMKDKFLPVIRERMKRRHHQDIFWYGNFRNQEPDSLVAGWETYDARPRFGTNSFGMRGRLAILSEGYSNNPFPRRIDATYNFLREILSLAAEQRVQLKAAIRASTGWHPDSVTVRSVFAPPVVQDVIAEITAADSDGSSGFSRRRRTGEFRTIRMPTFLWFTAARREALPAAYLIPPQYADLAGLLRRQGVVVDRLPSPWQGQVEAFHLDSVMAAPFPFEGHRQVTVQGRWNARDGAAAPGWFVVPTDQQQGVFAAYLLEPASEDGFANWNFLDRELRRGGEFPILRVRQPLAVPLEMLP